MTQQKQPKMSKSASFAVNKDDAALIAKIVDRAVRSKIIGEDGVEDLTMDITACHASGTPLRLSDFLIAPPFDFIHDILGISRHICRRTGKLLNLFLPRCTGHREPEGETMTPVRQYLRACLRTLRDVKGKGGACNYGLRRMSTDAIKRFWPDRHLGGLPHMTPTPPTRPPAGKERP